MSFHPEKFAGPAKQAGRFNGQVYGIPHWLCTTLLFTTKRELLKPTLPEFIDTAKAKELDKPIFAYSLDVYDLPEVYLNTISQTYGYEAVASAMNSSLDSNSTALLKEFASLCSSENGNKCRDGFGDGNDIDDFVQAILNGSSPPFSYFGYTEKLWSIFSKVPKDAQHRISFQRAPFGEDNGPNLAYSDQFVLNKNCDSTCQSIATAFVDFMLEEDMISYIALGKDAADPQGPRYLLPATRSFYESNQDPHYQKFREFLDHLALFPQFEYPEIQNTLFQELQRAIFLSS